MINRDGEISSSDMYHRLGCLEGKVDTAIHQISEYRKDINRCFERIRILETSMNKAIGVGMVLVVCIPIAVSLISGNNANFPREAQVERLTS